MNELSLNQFIANPTFQEYQSLIKSQKYKQAIKLLLKTELFVEQSHFIKAIDYALSYNEGKSEESLLLAIDEHHTEGDSYYPKEISIQKILFEVACNLELIKLGLKNNNDDLINETLVFFRYVSGISTLPFPYQIGIGISLVLDEVFDTPVECSPIIQQFQEDYQMRLDSHRHDCLIEIKHSNSENFYRSLIVNLLLLFTAETDKDKKSYSYYIKRDYIDKVGYGVIEEIEGINDAYIVNSFHDIDYRQFNSKYILKNLKPFISENKIKMIPLNKRRQLAALLAIPKLKKSYQRNYLKAWCLEFFIKHSQSFIFIDLQKPASTNIDEQSDDKNNLINENKQSIFEISVFNTISYIHEGVPQHDEKVEFKLLNSLDKNRCIPIKLNKAEASLLIYLMFERRNGGKYWLSEPEKHTDTLFEITNMLEPPKEFKKDLDDIIDRGNTNSHYKSKGSWIQDHANDIRKGQVTRIHNELYKQKEKRKFIQSVLDAHRSRRGVYKLNTCIKHVSII